MVLLTPASSKKSKTVKTPSVAISSENYVTPKKRQSAKFATPLSQRKLKKTPKIKQGEWQVDIQEDIEDAEAEKPVSSAKKVKKTPKKKIVKEVTKNAAAIDETLQDKYKIDALNVQKAVESVIKFTSENPKLKNKLFENDEFPLFLQINSIKVPKTHSKIIRIPLENSLYSDESEICLIVPDVKGIKNKEHEKHLEVYESLLRKKGVRNIKKIMTFHEFRTEYETFELKSKLVELYDVFLVDGKISGKVVKKAGKVFYQKRKIPAPVKLQVTKLKEHIESTLTKTPLYFHGKGDSFMVQFGHSKMDVAALVQNVFSLVEGLDKYFPGGFANLRNLNLKTFRGFSVPIYTTLKNKNDVSVPEEQEKKCKRITTVSGELSTRLNAEVTVRPTGEVFVNKIEGEEEEDDDEVESKQQDTKKKQKRNLEAEDAVKSKKAKKMKNVALEKEVKTKSKKKQKKIK